MSSRAAPTFTARLSRAIDSAIMSVAPVWGASRSRARLQALAYRSAYDAASRTHLRDQARDHGGPNSIVAMSAEQLRLEARALARNHDLIVGGLHTLAQNVIGKTGIGVEPQPHDANGDVVESVAEQLQNLRNEWVRRPEVTRQHDWASASRLCLRAWAVDGEMLVQHIIGPAPDLRHASRVPYSVELIECDRLPLDLDDWNKRISQGIEVNRWGEPIAFHLYEQHPGEAMLLFNQRTKRVDASRISHLKNIDRIGQRRGISILASIITRMRDLQDYEESERIAAKIAASMAAFIIKGSPDTYASNGTEAKRHMRFQSGMVFDDLRPGESVGTVDTNRPNPNLVPYRQGQLRAAAGGLRISYSSFSRDYEGSYSSKRQELVEHDGAYGVIGCEYVQAVERPTHENMVFAALASNQLVLPSGFPVPRLYDATYVLPSMPWIDPYKEAKALELMVDNTFMPAQEAIRRRGAQPRSVLDQQRQWIKQLEEWEIPTRHQAAADPVANPAANPANAHEVLDNA